MLCCIYNNPQAKDGMLETKLFMEHLAKAASEAAAAGVVEGEAPVIAGVVVVGADVVASGESGGSEPVAVVAGEAAVVKPTG